MNTPALSKFQSFRLFLRKVAALALPYFRSEEKWKARGLLAAIVLLNLGAVYMLVLINEWNRVFYDALQNKDAAVFWRELGRFTYLAFGFILIAVYRFYLTQLLQMRWRAWMTGHYLDRWLAHKAFYHLELARFSQAEGATPDNPDQRISEDVNQFTSYTVSLSMGLLNAVVTLLSFVGILWGLSGSFSFSFNGTEHSIPGFMVWMAVVYALAGSVIAHFLGRPLIGLNFRQQRVEADFRHHMVRVREYSESIALDRGEAVERGQSGVRFSAVLANYLALIKRQKTLTWFTVGFGQAAVVFPFVVAAPRFFSGAIQLGELMQIASAFGRVQDALSWFVDNYDALAALACHHRPPDQFRRQLCPGEADGRRARRTGPHRRGRHAGHRRAADRAARRHATHRRQWPDAARGRARAGQGSVGQRQVHVVPHPGGHLALGAGPVGTAGGF